MSGLNGMSGRRAVAGCCVAGYSVTGCGVAVSQVAMSRMTMSAVQMASVAMPVRAACVAVTPETTQRHGRQARGAQQ